MYPFQRFMGDSKRSVKNKAKFEGSICAHYLHRETSHFCSHYFNHLMLTPRIIRKEFDVNKRSQFTLSIFGLPDRPSGKENVHWLTQKELQSARIHVLINCIEVRPYLEELNASYFQSTGEQATTGHIHASFPAWIKDQLSCIVAPTQEILHLRNLSRGPVQRKEKTIYSGVFVKGVTDGGEDDLYGVVTHIYELAYNYLDSENRVVLFYCDWYDPSARGTKIDKKYNIVDIRMDRRYKEYDPFIMSHIVRQVYYVPYPSIQSRKHGWCVVIKTKPLGHIETDDLVEDAAYQEHEISQINDAVEVEEITNLCDTLAEGHQIDASVLLVDNNVDKEHEEFGFEDIIGSDDENIWTKSMKSLNR
ncbi:unnamed protein product [Lathyrus sativus]|nr:unnamed protein product [Lathyrus sativus]